MQGRKDRNDENCVPSDIHLFGMTDAPENDLVVMRDTRNMFDEERERESDED